MLDEIFDKVVPGLSKTIVDIFVSVTESRNLEGLNFEVFENLINDPATLTGLIFLVITLIFISSQGYSKLIYSMSYIYEHNNFGNGFLNKLKSMFMVVFFTLFLSTFCIAFISIIKILATKLGANSAAYKALFHIIFYVFLIIFYYSGLILLFKFSPKFKIPFKYLQPGIILALIPITLLTAIFQVIVTFSTTISKLGAISVFFFISTFVSMFSYFLYAGIIINDAYYKTFFSLRTVSKYSKKTIV